MRISPIVMVWRLVDVIDAEGVVEKRKAMVPVEKYRRHADRMYEDGAEYPLLPVEARSRAAHSRYFAALNEAYVSLPETISARWESSEHFRKWILIETGWFFEKEFTFEGRSAETQARRLATFIRTEDEYARVWVSQVAGTSIEENREHALDAGVEAWELHDVSLRERLRLVIRAALTALDRAGRSTIWKVIVRKAKSQDHASMDNAAFKDSSAAVLDFASSLIGTGRTELQRHAGRSA